MCNLCIAFDFIDHGVEAPASWKRTSGHIVWDVKMNFTRKSRWVMDGYKTPDLVTSNYAGVVSRESFRIAFIYAALNNLIVVAADIQNIYSPLHHLKNTTLFMVLSLERNTKER